jgi:nanoRNase/pAp phosphatase (c-di-AMP/oligoRNAs hydrolase)
VTGVLSFDGVLDFFDRNRGSRFLLTFHTIGDRDGVAAALGLSEMLNDSVVATPDFITNNAKHMLEKAGYNARIGSRFPNDAETAVILDANRMELMGEFERKLKRFSGEVLFIDHHSPPKAIPKNASLFNSEEYNSASSIVYDILKSGGVKVSASAARVLVNGIVADSADFQNSSARTFMQISELLDSAGMLYSEVVENVHGAQSPGIRDMVLKDLFSAHVAQYGNYLLVTGEAQFQANTAAETALRVGADAAVFWSVRKSEASVSARLRSPLDKKLSINLGAVLGEAGKILQGTGGGHPCAAGAFGRKKAGILDAGNYVINSIKKGFLSEGKT